MQAVSVDIALRKQHLKQYQLECLIKPNVHEKIPMVAKYLQNTKHPKAATTLSSTKVKNRKAYAQIAK